MLMDIFMLACIMNINYDFYIHSCPIYTRESVTQAKMFQCKNYIYFDAFQCWKHFRQPFCDWKCSCGVYGKQ